MDSIVEYLRTKLTERWNIQPDNGNCDNNNVILTGFDQYQDVVDSIKTIE